MNKLKNILKFSCFHLLVIIILSISLPYAYYKLELIKFENTTNEIIKSGQVDGFKFKVLNSKLIDINTEIYKPNYPKLNNKEFYQKFFIENGLNQCNSRVDSNCEFEIKKRKENENRFNDGFTSEESFKKCIDKKTNKCKKRYKFMDSNYFSSDNIAHSPIMFLTNFCNECSFYYNENKDSYIVLVYKNNKIILFEENIKNGDKIINDILSKFNKENEYLFYNDQYVHISNFLTSTNENFSLSSGDKKNIYSMKHNFVHHPEFAHYNPLYLKLDLIFKLLESFIYDDTIFNINDLEYDARSLFHDKSYTYENYRQSLQIDYINFKEILKINPSFYDKYNEKFNANMSDIDAKVDLMFEHDESIFDSEIVQYFMLFTVGYLLIIFFFKLIIKFYF